MLTITTTHARPNPTAALTVHDTNCRMNHATAEAAPINHPQWLRTARRLPPPSF